MLHLRNTQKLVPVNVKLLKDQVEKLRRIMRVKDCHLVVRLASNRTVHAMNRLDRGVDRPTDVLSYPAHELSPPEKPPQDEDGQRELGEIVLGMGYLRNASASKEKTLDEYLPIVITHGMCHLLGYDHEKDEDYQRMRRKERAVLRRLKELNEKEKFPEDSLTKAVDEVAKQKKKTK